MVLASLVLLVVAPADVMSRLEDELVEEREINKKSISPHLKRILPSDADGGDLLVIDGLLFDY